MTGRGAIALLTAVPVAAWAANLQQSEAAISVGVQSLRNEERTRD